MSSFMATSRSPNGRRVYKRAALVVPGRGGRARLGFALRDPRHSWNVSYGLGHGFLR